MKNSIQYPKIDGHRKHYVRYPVQGKDGLWYAADVDESGYFNPEEDPTKRGTESEADCRKWCDVHNKFHGWSEAEVNAIVSRSMGLTPAKS